MCHVIERSILCFFFLREERVSTPTLPRRPRPQRASCNRKSLEFGCLSACAGCSTKYNRECVGLPPGPRGSQISGWGAARAGEPGKRLRFLFVLFSAFREVRPESVLVCVVQWLWLLLRMICRLEQCL